MLDSKFKGIRLIRAKAKSCTYDNSSKLIQVYGLQPAPVYMSETFPPRDYPAALDLRHTEGKVLWFGRQPLLPVSLSFIRPASCLLNLYALFYPPIHGATQCPLRGRGQRLTTATRARGLLYGAKLVSHSPPRLKSCSRAQDTLLGSH